MTLQYTLQPTQGAPCAVLRALKGTPDDLVVLEDLLGATSLRPHSCWIVDNRQLCRPSSVAEVDRIVEMLISRRAAIRDARIAVVACDPSVYGMGRLFEMLCREGGLRARVHQRLEDAAAWLWPKSLASIEEATAAVPVSIVPERVPRLRGRLGLVEEVAGGAVVNLVGVRRAC